MYKYETHLHTSPVSKCATATIREHLEFYKSLGYDGIFVTNHFLDGSLNIDKTKSYEERLNFFYSDFEEGVKIGKELGIKVFCGIETNYLGADFLVYGLSKEWYLKNPQIMDMQKSEQLKFFMENGALVIHAHPFREAGYIDHIRLYPRCVHGVEVLNATKTDFENKMAKIYAEEYTNNINSCFTVPIPEAKLKRKMQIFSSPEYRNKRSEPARTAAGRILGIFRL